MAKRFLPGALSLAIATLSLNFVPSIDAKNRDHLKLAAAFQLPELPKLPSLGGASADWRQWDSFFTFIVKRVGQDVSGDLKDSLSEAFLDSRYELSATVTRLGSGQNPVPELFLNGWRQLSPVINKALPALYDLKRLGGDIEYNGNAGGEILAHYLSRHAIRKNEDKQQGGSLARATYAAYNGGPSHLTRYRAAKENPELKKVDEAFWDKFQAVSSGRELEVQHCYQK